MGPGVEQHCADQSETPSPSAMSAYPWRAASGVCDIRCSQLCCYHRAADHHFIPGNNMAATVHLQQSSARPDAGAWCAFQIAACWASRSIQSTLPASAQPPCGAQAGPILTAQQPHRGPAEGPLAAEEPLLLVTWLPHAPAAGAPSVQGPAALRVARFQDRSHVPLRHLQRGVGGF